MPCNCTGKIHMLNAVDAIPTLIGYYHCRQCHYTFCITFVQPYITHSYHEAPKLVAMHGDERYQYWKCHTPGSDVYTLVAKTRLNLKKELEEMGYTVEISVHELPAYRLYELK
jgi:hypothetical protein